MNSVSESPLRDAIACLNVGGTSTTRPGCSKTLHRSLYFKT